MINEIENKNISSKSKSKLVFGKDQYNWYTSIYTEKERKRECEKERENTHY